MLPTPSTSHVSFDSVYEPAEDSYLFLDTLSSESESAWLKARFGNTTTPNEDVEESSPTTTTTNPSPLIVEVGTGSGVVIAFLAANSRQILGREDVLTVGTDVNSNACRATRGTICKAVADVDGENDPSSSTSPSTSSKPILPPPPTAKFTASILADLCTPLRPQIIDILLFNPPYVPTPDLPPAPTSFKASNAPLTFDEESHLLSLSYAGGLDGMETTNRLLGQVRDVLDPGRGVAYVLLCAQNGPEGVKEGVRGWGEGWRVETVGRSGMKAGWEKLQIVRIWRE